MTIGHEFCGHIAEAPEGAVSRDGTPLKVGTPVMCDPRLNCRSCFSCKGGESNVCGKWGFLGLSGAGGGGFSEAVAVRADMCYALPENVRMDHAVLIEPLAVGRRAVRQSGISNAKFPSTSVLVIGGGPVGFSVLCNLKACGATKIFVSEPTAQRQEQCKDWCQQLINPIKQKVGDECRRLTDGRGVDLVFDCAGIPPGMNDGFDALAPKGTYVNVAGWEGEFVLPVGLWMMKELQMKTTLAYDDQDFAEVVKDFVAGKKPSRYLLIVRRADFEFPLAGKYKGAESMITARVPLDDLVAKGFEALVKHKDQHSKIIATPRTELLAQ